MSYEGYSQVLCANGHLRAFDCYADNGDLEDLGACGCGAPFVYRNMVDETNGMILDEAHTCPRKFEVNTPELTELCNLGHGHVIREVTYKIPPN